jgi:hypothetical protein
MIKKVSDYKYVGFVLLVFVLYSCDSVSSNHDQNKDAKYSVVWKSDVFGGVISTLGLSLFEHAPKTTFIEGNSVYLIGSRPAKLDLKTGKVQWQAAPNLAIPVPI